MVEKVDFVSLMMKEDLIEKKFGKMIPMLHSRGLRNPLDFIEP